MKVVTMPINNPYWDLLAPHVVNGQIPLALSGWPEDDVRHMFCWCVPSPETLAAIADHSQGRIVELGAGTGYMAAMLAQLGIDVVAYDMRPPSEGTNAYHFTLEGSFVRPTQEYYPVWRGDSGVLKNHGDRTLFVTWPESDLQMRTALLDYPGRRFIGVVPAEHTDPGQHWQYQRLLQVGWRLVLSQPVISWEGNGDFLCVYER